MKIRYLIAVFATALLGWVGTVLSLPAQEEAYRAITGPCALEFPVDHGAHPGFRTEWWYYTGNLQSKSGDHFGFQLTFFRRQISPPGAEKTWPKPPSAWRTQQIFVAHAALTDVSGKRFQHAEQIGREMPALAGASQENGQTSIFLKNWSSRWNGNEHTLEAKAEDFSFKLRLNSLKAPVLHGNAGYSQKGTAPESASCYYSLTRLEADGELSLGGGPLAVHGTAWMDHEFSSAPLESELAGWDWFSVQLADNSELMIYLLRREDGAITEASSGTFVDASGQVSHLAHDGIKVEILDHWRSPRSGATYPSGWRLTIPSVGLALIIRPRLSDQELQSPDTTGITYWEGSVSVNGTRTGTAVTGDGYVELTGYASSMGGRM